MRPRILLLAVATLLLLGSAREREAPTMACKREIEPRVRCDAKGVWPVVPDWRVYYPDAEPSDLSIADLERGIAVYLTLPREKWARLEMCYPSASGKTCVGSHGGWFSGRLLWRDPG